MLDNLSLVPHDKSIIIKDITPKINYIHLMKTLMLHALQAIEYFDKRELFRFDAQVGETLCQIRAYKIYSLASFSPLFNIELSQLKTQLARAISQLDLYFSDYQCYLKMHKSQRPEQIRAPVTLYDFYLEMDCVVTLSSDFLFLFTSYFLCEYHLIDEEHIPIAINVAAIASACDLTTGYAKKLSHFYQKTLSQWSCHFILALLEELPECSDIQPIIHLLHRPSDEGRMVLPCHAVTEIIIQHMIKNDAHALLILNIKSGIEQRRLNIHIQGSRSIDNFIIYTSNTTWKNPPACVVFYGECSSTNLKSDEEILHKLELFGIKKIFLSNNAAHPQYSGAKLASFRENPYETIINENGSSMSPTALNAAINRSVKLIALQKEATSIGCTLNHQTLFFLKHIFCDTLQRHELYRDNAPPIHESKPAQLNFMPHLYSIAQQV